MWGRRLPWRPCENLLVDIPPSSDICHRGRCHSHCQEGSRAKASSPACDLPPSAPDTALLTLFSTGPGTPRQGTVLSTHVSSLCKNLRFMGQTILQGSCLTARKTPPALTAQRPPRQEQLLSPGPDPRHSVDALSLPNSQSERSFGPVSVRLAVCSDGVGWGGYIRSWAALWGPGLLEAEAPRRHISWAPHPRCGATIDLPSGETSQYTEERVGCDSNFSG